MVCVVALALTGCGGVKHGATMQLGHGVSASGMKLPERAAASVAAVPKPVTQGGFASFSPVYELRPAGKLPATLTVTVPTRPIPPGAAVLAATAESPTGPWDLVQVSAAQNGHAVTFRTKHFSFWTIVGFDPGSFIGTFKSDVLDVLDRGATTTVAKPTCSSQGAAVDDYNEAVTARTNTIYWCIGASGATPILKVVNNRRFPLEMAHPGFSVVDKGSIDYGALASLSHVGSGSYSIIAPGGQITYSIDVQTGQYGEISTQFDGLGQSLYQLQTGVNTMFEILTRFGWGAKDGAVDVTNSLLSDAGCLNAVSHGPVAMFAACFSPEQILKAFGKVRSLILIPIVAAGPIVAFFKSEGQALADQFNSGDKYVLRVAHLLTPACTAQTLFAAAVAKEHLNVSDPGYASVGGPGASGVECDGTWAVAGISRPDVGDTDGATLFHVSNGAWQEAAVLGGAVVECNLEENGVPANVASVLGHGVQGSAIVGCDYPRAYQFAVQQWKSSECNSSAGQVEDWEQIAQTLSGAQPDYGGDPAGYKAAIAELIQLSKIPETDASAADGVEETSDVNALDIFFKTPGLYTSSSQPSCPVPPSA